MKTSAVIIAAYKAERWIGECLDSWSRVRIPKGWRIEYRIGVDGCEATAKELARLGVPYHASPANVGPYIIRNSLIELRQADAYTIFDADDRALPNHQELLLPLAGTDGIGGGARYETTAEGKRRHNQPLPHMHGVSVLSHHAWDTLGGYRPWRIKADMELHQRARTLGIPKRNTREAVYERRRHPDSLTRQSETGRRSLQRIQATEQARRMGGRKERVEPETVMLYASIS